MKVSNLGNNKINKNSWKNCNIKIGVFNSSSNLGFIHINRVKLTKEIFDDLKIKIDLGKLTFNKNSTYRSGSIKERADEFNFLIKNNNIVLSMIGGFNTSSILHLVDYKFISKNKIKIVGCSDTTALLLAVYNQTGIPTYYGHSFLMSYYEQKEIRDFNINELIQTVIIDFPHEVNSPKKYTIDRVDWKLNKIKNKKMLKNSIKTLNGDNKVIEGRLLGGNLNTMASLIGTKYMPLFKNNDILFIEDSCVNEEITERNMSVLKNSGILDKVACILIGKIENYNNEKGKRQYHEILLEFLNRNIPIMYDFSCSHIQPSNILKIGAKTRINFKNKRVYILE
ncbi:LD-carboxypeptidase [Mesomycoplasma moatsii]|uniref:LD-carboxypeptidase n=1 Tax=Mesomycoplasma moatsii TaxID=171287 RepID=UPI0003B562DB